MTGTVGILNVGAGDTKLVFDKSNPIETARAARIVKDMIRRGYALFVEVPAAATGKGKGKGRIEERKEYRRATDFDENTAEYIIADFDSAAAADADREEETAHAEEQASPEQPQPAGGQGPKPRGARGGGGKRGRMRIAANQVTGVAVARTAGG